MPDRICPECDTRADADVCPRCGTRMLFDVPSEPGFDPLLGKVFDGRYRLDEQLGKGGMGVVYRATQIAMGKVVAVKVLRGELTSHREAARRFHREAKAASLLSHPHTVRVFDFGQTRDRELFMVMEYLQGRSLGALLAEQGRLPVERAAAIVSEIAEALMEAHGVGLVHRDLKPDNVILVDLPGHPDFVKVLDFGIAKLLSEGERGSDVTRTGMVVGTPTYMAPEQVQGSRALSPALDVYALGVLLYQALAGAPPFTGTTPLEVVMAHVNDPAPALPADLGIPADVRRLVGAMLDKDPAGRPSAAAVFEALQPYRLAALTRRLTTVAGEATTDQAAAPTLLVEVREPASDAAAPRSFDDEAPPPRGRNRLWLAVGLASFALAGVLLAWYAGRDAPDAPARSRPHAAVAPRGVAAHPATREADVTEASAPTAPDATPAATPDATPAATPDVAPVEAGRDVRPEAVPAAADAPRTPVLDATPEKRERIKTTSGATTTGSRRVREPAVPPAPVRHPSPGDVEGPGPGSVEGPKPKYEPVW